MLTYERKGRLYFEPDYGTSGRFLTRLEALGAGYTEQDLAEARGDTAATNGRNSAEAVPRSADHFEPTHAQTTKRGWFFAFGKVGLEATFEDVKRDTQGRLTARVAVDATEGSPHRGMHTPVATLLLEQPSGRDLSDFALRVSRLLVDLRPGEVGRALESATWSVVNEFECEELDAKRTSWPEVLTLEERIARPVPPVTYRIEGWQPADSRIVLAAQFKAGKTTLIANLARCLVDGAHWLGSAAVQPVNGTVVLFDNEMSERQLDEWLHDQQFMHPEKLVVVPLRGRLGTFNITDAEVRGHWAAILRDLKAEYVILDCLRPMLDSLGLDESHDAGRFLVEFDALLTEGAVRDACLVHHMGHVGERSRGDSRLRDWPDAEWRLVRESDDPSSPRYISAFGRDVDVAETALRYDAYSRRLELSGGTRRDTREVEALEAVIELLREGKEAMSRNRIELGLNDHPTVKRAAVRGALKKGVEDKRLEPSKGARGANLYQLASSPDLAK